MSDIYLATKNSDIIESATPGLSLVKLDKDIQRELEVANRVFNTLLEDGFHGPYVLGESLWAEFCAAYSVK